VASYESALGAQARTRTEPPKGLGVGIILGVPTGISFGYRVNSKSHFDAAVAWSVTHDSVHIHVNSLFELMQIVDPNAPMYQFPLYAGLGVRVQLDPGQATKLNLRLGLRVPVGITFLPQTAPFEVFAEIAPVMSLIPDTSVSFDGAIGARYYF
jgi:hypothetical protein